MAPTSTLFRDATVLSASPWHRKVSRSRQRGRAMPPWMTPEDINSRQVPALKTNLACWGSACRQSPLNPAEDLLRLALWLTFCSRRLFFFKYLAEIMSQTDLLNTEEKPARVRSPAASTWRCRRWSTRLPPRVLLYGQG